MSNSKQLRKGIVLNYVNMALGTLIPLLYTPVMLSLLGQSEYGLYKLTSNVTSYLSLLSLGIGGAVTRYLIKSYNESGKEAEERVLGLFVRLFRVIAVICIIIGIVLTLSLHIWYDQSLSLDEIQRMKILSAIMTANMALSLMMTPYSAAVSAHERFVFLQCMNIALTAIGPIVNIIVLYLGYASIGMAVASLAVSVVVRLLFFIYVTKSIGITARVSEAPTSMLKEIIVFSFWIFLANVVDQLYNATDTVLIGMVPALATTGVAVYNIGAVFNRISLSLTTGISNLLSPKTNKMIFAGASNTELTDLAIRVGRLQGYIFSLVVSGFIVFGQPFIHFYVGDGYADAYWVAIFMMVPHVIPLSQSVCLSIIVAKNQHKFRSLVYLAIAIINVVGTWFILPIMGIKGAALISGLAMILGHGFIMNWYYDKKTGLEIKRFWKEISNVFFIPLLLCCLFLLLSQFCDFYNWKILLSGIIIYTSLFIIIQYCCITNDYEKGLIKGGLSRFVNLFYRCLKSVR